MKKTGGPLSSASVRRYILVAAFTELFLMGCTSMRSTASPRKEIAIVAGIPSPAKYTVIGHARGFAFSDLEDEARARGGDAITEPTTVSQRGLLESDVLKKK
jgi:hypothetical protein